MKRDVRLSNKYRVALLEYNGISAPMVSEDGFQRWEYEDSAELQEILKSFDKDQPINLRCYVDYLRKVEGQLRNARFQGKRERREWDKPQQERA